jgi:hypothetical protein
VLENPFTLLKKILSHFSLSRSDLVPRRISAVKDVLEEARLYLFFGQAFDPSIEQTIAICRPTAVIRESPGLGSSGKPNSPGSVCRSTGRPQGSSRNNDSSQNHLRRLGRPALADRPAACAARLGRRLFPPGCYLGYQQCVATRTLWCLCECFIFLSPGSPSLLRQLGTNHGWPRHMPYSRQRPGGRCAR